MRVCMSERERERKREGEEGNKKTSLSRGFPGQLLFIHSALTLLAKSKECGVYSKIWHTFIAVLCTMLLDTISVGFSLCNPMEHTAVV